MKYGHFVILSLWSVLVTSVCSGRGIPPLWLQGSFFLSGEFFLTRIYALGPKDAFCFTNDKERMSPLIPPL